ncbi:MAG TPA: 2-phospho-L-lactate transferase, partial [Acidimicrobiales bacterium]|nr:2-phospho-L-lactate transferase [Acidimicrobiales bacterium]
MFVALAGGVGGARLLAGLVDAVDATLVTAVVNVADDFVLHGLTICPDLDTVTYTLAGANDTVAGWGLAGETWAAMEALERLGGQAWFRLGDRDLATHLYRTQRLAEGATVSDVAAELARAHGLRCTILPVTDELIRTMVTVAGEEIGFQDYFVARRHSVAVEAVRFAGIETARPAPGVIEAIGTAARVIVCPSNPVVSIGPVLDVPGVAAAVSARRDDVVAVSPIVGGAALKGPADRMLTELGHESSVVGVARMW